MGESSTTRNRAVLVTGCSSGIGRAVALRLAEAGFSVFATVRKEEDRGRLETLDLPSMQVLAPVDMRDEEQIEAAVESLSASLELTGSTLYGIVSNAGGGAPAPVELIPTEMVRAEVNTRIVGPIALLKGTLPLLRRGRGRILWITTPAIIPTPYVASIHACDFAVNCLARTLDIELARWKIPSIMIRCGGIKTPAGLRTTSDVEHLLAGATSDQRALYETALRNWAAEMAEFDRRRAEPLAVAETVLRALRDERPRRRYSIGHMARLAAILEALPQSVGDAILKRRF